MDNKKEGQDINLGEGFCVKRQRKEPGILSNYHRYIGHWKMALERGLNVDKLIDGKSEFKTIHNNNGLQIEWQYRKRNGEHKKDSGLLKFIDLSSGKTAAYLEVVRGNASAIYITGEDFAKNIDNYKDMPRSLYSCIKKTFYYKTNDAAK
jgi:hypothetical protein